MNEDDMMNTLVSALGGTPPAEPTEPAQTTEPAPAADPEPTEPAAQNSTTEPQEPPAQEPAVDTPAATPAQPDNNKATQAFIHMRQENKSMHDMLNNIAGVLGIDSKDEQQIMTTLQARITDAQAKQNNVPPELMRRLNDLEQQNQAHTAAERQRNTAIGFQRVADKFKLDQNGLNQFAQDLVKAGINPLEQEVDLIREYKMMHFDDEVQRAVEAAVAAEQARAAKAATQSSTPGTKTGGPTSSGGPEKINSIRELESWMRTTQQ